MLNALHEKPKSLDQLHFEEASLLYSLKLIRFEIERQVNKKSTRNES